MLDKPAASAFRHDWTVEEIADVRTEWEDRFGPLPAPAKALLEVARLRAECLRLGITDISVTPPRRGMGRSEQAAVKMAPITLLASAEVRLRRLAPGATYQPDLHRLLLSVAMPADGHDFAPGLVQLLSELVPADT